jgi:DNA-binding NtrC family response regulator
VKTLVLTDVGLLSAEEQQELNDWLTCDGGNTQVVTTSAKPLFPLVKSGAFHEMLYYRLNVMYVGGDVGGPDAAEDEGRRVVT